MPTNKNVLIDREKYIGSSEISTIMDINPYKSRFELLLEKASLIEQEQVENEYVDFGSKMEKYIRDFINKDYKDDLFVEDTVIVEKDIINLRCNYDGKNSTTGLEIKTTSHIYENVREYKSYVVQLLYGMILDNLKYGKLAVYKRNEDFQLNFEKERLQIFDIAIEDFQDWVEQINIAVDKFREDLVKVKENPFITEEELQPKELVEISNRVIALETKLKEFKAIETEQKNLKSELKKAMEKHHVKKWITNNGVKITLIEDGKDTEVKVFNEDKFKEDNPEMYENYLETKIKKGRAGSLRITI